MKETAELDDDDVVRVTYVSFDGEGGSSVSHGFFERVHEGEAADAV